MAKYAGTQFSLFLVDGYNLAASLSESATMDKESVTQQTNPFGATSEQHTPLNVERGVLNVGGGFFDAATNALLGVFNAVRGLKRIVVIGYEGNIIGKHFTGYQGVYDSKYTIQDVKDNLTKANLGLMLSGDVNEGVIVQSLATFTADQVPPTGDTPVDFTLDPVQNSIPIASNTLANPTVVTTLSQVGIPIPHRLTTGDKVLFSGSNSTPSINGVQTVTVISPTTFSVPVNVTTGGTTGTFLKVNSNAGGVGYLQVTAYSGFTATVAKIVHSADDTTYAALVTFADLAAVYTPSKQRVTAAGNVDRYLSSNIDVTGAGSVTLFMGFARN